MTALSLVRHGRASAHAEDYDQLSDDGFAQARALGRSWGAERRAIDRVYFGPRRRHRETAEAFLETYVAAGRVAPALVRDDGLDEHQGILLTRLLLDEMRERDDELGRLAREASSHGVGLAGYIALFRRVMKLWSRGELDHPEVEPWAAFRARVVDCLSRMEHGGEHVVAVTSAGLVGAAVATALGLDDDRAVELSFVVQNASNTELSLRSGRASLFRFNEVGHLTDPQLRTFL